MGKGVSKPADRNYGKEIKQTVRAQIETAPEILAARQKYDSQFTDLNIDNLRQAIMGQISNASQVAPQLQQMDSQYQQQAIQNDPILRMLNEQATGELRQGGNMSEAEKIALDESVNSRYAARGMSGSNRNLIEAILNRGQYANERQNNRRGFAASVYGLNQGAGGAGRSLLQGLVNPQSGSTAVGQSWINPESAYAQDIYNTNYNANMSAYNSSKNRGAALIGAAIGGVTGMFSFGGGGK